MKQVPKTANRKSRTAAAALRIDGDMTIYQADELKQKLLGSIAGPATGLQVDLHNGSEIDTAGVQLLIAAKHAATAVGKTLTLTACSRAVTEVLELFGLVSFFADPAAAPAA
jgi:anti-anti-sigma factor